jgi:hypothetical protein
MWNGKDLSEWDTFGCAFFARNGAIEFDSRGSMTPFHIQTKADVPANAFRMEYVLEVQECGDSSLAGFQLTFGGQDPARPGNLSACWGDHIYLNRLNSGRQWDKVQTERISKAMEKATYRFELICSGRDLTIRVHGVGELKAPGVLPQGQRLRPVLIFQDVKGRIRRVEKK